MRGVDGWLISTRARAGDRSGQGCSDFIANASRALQLESYSWDGLGPKLHRARLGQSRAGQIAWATLLCLRRRGLTAVTSSSERWAIVEAQAAAISSLGVAETFPA